MTDKTIPGYPGIWVNPNRRFGKPCIEGTRLGLSEVLADTMEAAKPVLKSIWNLDDEQVENVALCLYKMIMVWEEKHWAEEEEQT